MLGGPGGEKIALHRNITILIAIKRLGLRPYVPENRGEGVDSVSRKMIPGLPGSSSKSKFQIFDEWFSCR